MQLGYEGKPTPNAIDGASGHPGSFGDSWRTVARDARLYPYLARISAEREYKVRARATMQAARSARSRNIQAARDAEPTPLDPFSADLRFIRRHPRYWSNEERGVFHAALQARADTLQVMAREPHNEGRGQVDSCSDAINATEVRYSRRRSVPRSDEYLAANGALIATSEAGYLELSADAERFTRPPRYFVDSQGKPIDTACYSIKPDGTRSVFEVPSDDAERKPTRKQASKDEQRIARMLAAAGTIRMADQD